MVLIQVPSPFLQNIANAERIMSHIIEKWISAIAGKISNNQLFHFLSESCPPLTSIVFTRECSMGCKHCLYPRCSKEDVALNNLSRIDSAIEATRQAGVKDLIHVGRTLKSEHLPILKKYQDLGMSINLIDNGMGTRFIPEIKQAGLFFNGGIDISIDGDQASHDTQRQLGSYSQAVEAAKKFQKVANNISITSTASVINYNRLVNGLSELEETLPFARVLQITTTSPTNFQPQRMTLDSREMQKVFSDFEKAVKKSSKIRMLIYRLEDILAILPALEKYGQPKTKYISIVWQVGKSVVEFFPQSIVTVEEFAIDSNGRHALPFSFDWHLDERPEEWEVRNDLILSDPDKSYENLVYKYKQAMGSKIIQQERIAFQKLFC